MRTKYVFVCMNTTQPQKKNDIFAILQQPDGP